MDRLFVFFNLNMFKYIFTCSWLITYVRIYMLQCIQIVYLIRVFDFFDRRESKKIMISEIIKFLSFCHCSYQYM